MTDQRREYLRAYRSSHPRNRERENAASRARYAANRDAMAKKKWAAICASEADDPSKRERRLAKKREHARRSRINDPAGNKARKTAWRRTWRKTEAGRLKSREELQKPTNKLRHAVRHRLWLAIHGTKKIAPTLAYIGCSVNELKTHLESQFKPGMTWANHGVKGWHIDHKRPLASFCFFNADGSLNEEQVRAAMHYTNLQPLWYWENASKGAKII